MVGENCLYYLPLLTYMSFHSIIINTAYIVIKHMCVSFCMPISTFSDMMKIQILTPSNNKPIHTAHTHTQHVLQFNSTHANRQFQCFNSQYVYDAVIANDFHGKQ